MRIHTKRTLLLTIAVITVIAVIASVVVIAIAIGAIPILPQHNMVASQAVPEIMIVYNRHEFQGLLLGYNWNGKAFPVLNEERPYRPVPTVNATYGTSVQFIARNVTEQPSYYILSTYANTNSTKGSMSNSELIIDHLKLDSNTVKLATNGIFEYFHPNRKYTFTVSAIWVTTGGLFSDTHQDIVTYTFLVNTVP